MILVGVERVFQPVPESNFQIFFNRRTELFLASGKFRE